MSGKVLFFEIFLLSLNLCPIFLRPICGTRMA
jgi:hypothetical protein